MALPRRMQLAIRSGARAGRRSKCCEDVYSETTRASYDRVFWTEYTAESTTAHPPHSLVSGWAFAGPRLTSLPWPCSLQTQPARPTFTGSSNTQLYSVQLYSGQSCADGVPTVLQGCGGGGSWGGLRRQFRCFRHCEKLKLMEIPCLPSLNMHSCYATKVGNHPYSK